MFNQTQLTFHKLFVQSNKIDSIHMIVLLPCIPILNLLRPVILKSRPIIKRRSNSSSILKTWVTFFLENNLKSRDRQVLSLIQTTFFECISDYILSFKLNSASYLAMRCWMGWNIRRSSMGMTTNRGRAPMQMTKVRMTKDVKN